MCGRYVQDNDREKLEEYYAKHMYSKYHGPSYNIAPSQEVLVVTSDGIEEMRWGLVPQWAKDGKTSYSMINARAETLIDKPTYKKPLATQRCLVPASGFYEWRKDGESKWPYYFHLRSRGLFSFAGLYVTRKDTEGNILKSFTVITTGPNKTMEPMHNRMPVILSREEEDDWLDESITDPTAVLPILDPYMDSDIEAYPVGQRVGNVANNDALLIVPTE